MELAFTIATAIGTGITTAATGRLAGHATRTMRLTVRAMQVSVELVSFVSRHAASWSKALRAVVPHGWYLPTCADAPRSKICFLELE